MTSRILLTTTLLTGATLGTASAVSLAFTSFDSRTASGNTASDLNWILDGVSDPGVMSASEFEGGNINLFNSGAAVTDRFVPGINTGNGNTSWVTSVSLTARPDSIVTVEDITLDYVAINGGQAVNVSRRSDFTATLLSPSGDPLATASLADAVSGTNADPIVAPVALVLDSPVELSDPGAYSLVLRGGDFLGDNETGNHTGIDNLSINGTVAPIPEPSTAFLSALALLGLVSSRRRR